MELYIANILALQGQEDKVIKYLGFKPKGLVSFYNLKKSFTGLPWCEKLFLDSGAFSAYTSKAPIQLQDYMDYLSINKNRYSPYACLDDLTDPDKSLANFKLMCKQGFTPMPCLHYGESFKYLDKYLKYTDYIGVGGMVKKLKDRQQKDLFPWLDSLFTKYPGIKVHGFGVSEKDFIKRYPWHSIDSSKCHTNARYGLLLTPWGSLGLGDKIKSHQEYLTWKNPLTEKAVKDWVKKEIGIPWKLLTTDKDASIYRFIANIKYFDAFVSNVKPSSKEYKTQGFFN